MTELGSWLQIDRTADTVNDRGEFHKTARTLDSEHPYCIPYAPRPPSHRLCVFFFAGAGKFLIFSTMGRLIFTFNFLVCVVFI